MNIGINSRKVGIIGCGFVGSSSAFALMQSGIFSEIVLIDANGDKAQGEAMDIAHGVPFSGSMKIYSGNYSDIADAALIILTAGVSRKPGETRLDLVKKNVVILKSILPEIKKVNFQGILLIVANPVDILTYVASKLSGLPENHVFGSGTSLDTSRLKCEIAKNLSVDSRSVHAFIVGEHGDSGFPAWGSANISGISMKDFCKFRGYNNYDEFMGMIEHRVRGCGAEIIKWKGATYYGIAMVVKRICEIIVYNEKAVLPVTHVIYDSYGVDDIALSFPSIIGKDGLISEIPISLTDKEIERLHISARALKEVTAEII